MRILISSARTLTNTPEQLHALEALRFRGTDRDLGEALGQKYVAKAFPPAAKARAVEMVNNLIDALRDDLKTFVMDEP